MERFINKPKHFRRVFSRFEKLDTSHLGFLHLAGTVIWLRHNVNRTEIHHSRCSFGEGNAVKLYTKTGDHGETALFGGGRVQKDHQRVAAYGTIDELNSLLGVARAAKPCAEVDDWLDTVQRQLFQLGTDLATPLESAASWVTRVAPEQTQWLEASIDRMTAELEPLRNFILPGGVPAAAHVQLARAVCRRAEREIVALASTDEINPNILAYINRLSDWLFTLARYENMRAGEAESKWSLRP